MLEVVVVQQSEILIEATPKAIFDVLADAEALPEWLPMVERCESRGPRGIGGERVCEVDWGGRRGMLVERCTERVMRRRLAFVVDEDTLGFSKMFDEFGFAYDLVPEGPGRTRVRMEGLYRPRGFLAKMMDVLLMRRRLAKSRCDILGYLKTHVESQPRRLAGPFVWA